jgi:DeoR/GlpR family transcriptional regulator of sugar metabolism
MLAKSERAPRARVCKKERLENILLELKLRPHVRTADLAQRFGVSYETIRRDCEALSEAGLVSRAHGGASQPTHGHYPSFDERNRDRIEERERIGRSAAVLVEDGDTLMVDAGSTTLQFARFLAYQSTACTVITNSLNAAITLGQSDAVDIVMCPGDVLPSEAAVVGPDAIEFIARHNVQKCFIGASSVSAGGVSEAVRGFAAIKRAMLGQSEEAHLLVDGTKIGGPGLSSVAELAEVATVILDKQPEELLACALESAGVRILVAAANIENTKGRTPDD